MTHTIEKTKEDSFNRLVKLAREQLTKVAFDSTIEYPGTGYFLPTIYSYYNQKITTVSQLEDILSSIVLESSDRDLELQSLLLIELYEALIYSDSAKNPYTLPYIGFIPDSIFRQLGVPLVDGSLQGVGVIVGSVKNVEFLVSLVKEFQKNKILLLLVGDCIKQLQEIDFELGVHRYIVPVGENSTALTHVYNLTVRMALSFGRISPGDRKGLLAYIKNKIPIFTLVLGESDQILQLITSGYTVSGIPVILFSDKDENIPIPSEHHKNLVSCCLATKGIKTTVEDVPIPIDYSFAYEGQSVRKTDVFVEFGGGNSRAFELLKMKPIEQIEDGKISLFGPDVDELEAGSVLPLAMIIEVAGKAMQEDFEPVLERQLHHFLNFGDGIWHNAQRDIIWIRINKDAVKKGFMIKHLGQIIYSKLHSNFSNVIDKVQISIYTLAEEVSTRLAFAKEKYRQRDERINNMNDETTSTFYSCLLCQSFAPNHVCVISPERLGLCGAVNWLDAKTSHNINPTGGNYPIEVGELVDSKYGIWKGVNEYVFRESHETIKEVSLYSIMTNPLTSCGCFECIATFVPEVNGIMIITREYSGSTPLGLQFTTLAGMVGGGVQTPGFIGIGKNYILSKKFLAAEGGLKRIVWMPRELKLALEEKIDAIEPGFTSKIADEEVVTTIDELLNFLSEVNHPVLSMDPLL